MTIAEFLALFEDIVEEPPGTLSIQDNLKDRIEKWDSLAALNLMALADERFGITLPPKGLASAQTIGDLVALMGEHISA